MCNGDTGHADGGSLRFCQGCLDKEAGHHAFNKRPVTLDEAVEAALWHQRSAAVFGHFAEEERTHLERMERAGVIQPSQSEWASAPVLIRKRDGGVRWCIDFINK